MIKVINPQRMILMTLLIIMYSYLIIYRLIESRYRLNGYLKIGMGMLGFLVDGFGQMELIIIIPMPQININ